MPREPSRPIPPVARIPIISRISRNNKHPVMTVMNVIIMPIPHPTVGVVAAIITMDRPTIAETTKFATDDVITQSKRRHAQLIAHVRNLPETVPRAANTHPTRSSMSAKRRNTVTSENNTMTVKPNTVPDKVDGSAIASRVTPS
jgi:hypothetical protein